MVRVAILVLLAVAVAAVVNRWRRRVPPKAPARAVEATEKCPRCGSYVLAGARCDCT